MEIECPHCGKSQLFDAGLIKDQWHDGEVFLDACACCEKKIKITMSVPKKKELENVKRNQ